MTRTRKFSLMISPGRVAEAVVAWYRVNARDLPWRREPYCGDPYAIWVSEVMLQQTQVKTVIPYWERWMAEFPNVHGLAAADEEEVLRAWEGLGYYRRVRNLQKAARWICDERGGEFPRSYEEVLELPGVGRYTAGAICSIAFGQAVPILDGNVARVLSRVRTVSDESELWEAAGELVRAAVDASALNQGLMELGAMVCSPRDPSCGSCVIRKECGAHRTGRVKEFPAAIARPAAKARRFVAVVLRNGNSVLVRKRADGQVNGGLWEFPNFEAVKGRGGVAGQLETFLDGSNVKVKPLATIRHTITNYRITMLAYAGTAQDRRAAARLNARWIAIPKLEGIPFSSAHAKLRGLLQGDSGTRNRGETS